MKGKRFTEAQKSHALLLVASGMGREQIAETVGTTTESIRRWLNRAKADGTMPKPPTAQVRDDAATDDSVTVDSAGKSNAAQSGRSPYSPKDPGQGLSVDEHDAIVELKQRHPSYGPAQVRAQLKRFKGWRLSIRAIGRVFKANGFSLVHRGSLPEGPDPIRFEAPHRKVLWMMDFAEMRAGGDRLYLLVAIDDFSRFCVGHALADSPSSEVAVNVLPRGCSVLLRQTVIGVVLDHTAAPSPRRRRQRWMPGHSCYSQANLTLRSMAQVASSVPVASSLPFDSGRSREGSTPSRMR